MPFFPIGEWRPDQPQLGIIGTPPPNFVPYTSLAKNVMPQTAQSYGPMPSPIAGNAAIVGRCNGTYSVHDESRKNYIIAGDTTKLYLMQTGNDAFDDLGTGSFNCPGDGFWAMTSFGARAIITDYADPVQTIYLGVDNTFSDLSPDAPRAKYCAVVRDFVVLGNTYDPVDGPRLSRVWWPAIGDPLSWPTPGTDAAVQVQSDFQDLQQSDLGEVTGIVGGVSGADGLVFCERGIYRMNYVGSPAIFNFDVVEGASGTRAPRSIVQRHFRVGSSVGSFAYYLGEDGFYAHDGSNAIPIGADRINRWFFDNLNSVYQERTSGASDPARQIIVWAFPSVNTSDGLLDMLLVFNWNLNMWAYGDLSSAPLEVLGRAIGLGYTLDQIDPFGTSDTLPAPLDSSFWIGGGLGLGGFDTQHRLVHMNGANLAPLLETVELQPVPGRRSNIMMARPITDASSATIATGYRENQWDAVGYGPDVGVNIYGECPQLSSGRYVRFRVGAPAGTAFSHIQGVDTGDDGIKPAGRL